MTAERTASFLGEVALALCSSLEAHVALERGAARLRPRLPFDRAFIEHFDPGLGAMRTIAKLDAEGAAALDVVTGLSGDAKQGLTEIPAARQPVVRFDRSHPLAAEMYAYHRLPDPAQGVLLLLGETEAPLGTAVLIRDAAGFTDEELALLEPLRSPLAVMLDNALAHGELAQLRALLEDDKRFLFAERAAPEQIIGADAGLRPPLEAARRVARTDSAVLLLGETGTGKDLFASAIHRLSPRAEGPFISLNCGAIPESLLDSELFGHEAGAFTGASQARRGRFERAHGGTLFLDEVGELTPAAQVRLLRALQSSEIERVGGHETVHVDVRIVAATHQPLEARVKAGTFREDLWYRLQVFPIRIPALRDRRLDIPALVRHFVQAGAKRLRLGAPPALAEGAIDPLLDYPWPGNVRELEHVVERALILALDGEPLRFEAALGVGGAAPHEDHDERLDAVIAGHIRRVLEATEGRIEGPRGAAERLGLNPSTLRSKMRKLGVTSPSTRNRG